MNVTRALFAATMMLAMACVPTTASDDDDGGGCQADVDCKGDRVCSDGECVDAGEASCDAVDEACEADSCCGASLCAQYSGEANSFTVCEALCAFDAECPTGCCLPLGDSGSSTCAPSELCMGGGGSPPAPGSGGTGGVGGGSGPGMGGNGGSEDPGMGGSPAPEN